TKFRQKYREDADRLLVTIGQAPQRSVDLAQREWERVQNEFETALANLQEQEARAQQSLAAAQKGDDVQHRLDALHTELAELQDARLAATQQLGEQQARIDHAWALLLPMLTLLLIGAVVFLVILAIRQNLLRALPYYALAGVCSVVIVAIGILHTEQQP